MTYLPPTCARVLRNLSNNGGSALYRDLRGQERIAARRLEHEGHATFVEVLEPGGKRVQITDAGRSVLLTQ